jgi:hypothetical protein
MLPYIVLVKIKLLSRLCIESLTPYHRIPGILFKNYNERIVCRTTTLINSSTKAIRKINAIQPSNWLNNSTLKKYLY